MLDRTNTGPAGADEITNTLKPMKAVSRRRKSPEKGGDNGAHQLAECHELSSPVIAAVLGGDGAPADCDTHYPCSPIVSEIVQLWRLRQRWHRAEKSLALQGKAICRAFFEGDKLMASKVFDAKPAGTDIALSLTLMPFYKGIDNFEPERKKIEKRLKQLAQSLTIWPWIKDISGFGPLNLAALIGEAGDIGSYRNPSCLWKRMGMAVIDGGRQRKVSDADQALIHGYSPPRRAVAYLIGECLVKTGDRCRYREVYTARRARTAETHPDWTPKHSHNDAMRVMTKRVLRDLWVAWRAASPAL